MKWISVKEKYPEPLVDVLCYMDGLMAVGCCDGKNGYGAWTMNIDGTHCQETVCTPTYWMPLPSAPDLEEK